MSLKNIYHKMLDIFFENIKNLFFYNFDNYFIIIINESSNA